MKTISQIRKEQEDSLTKIFNDLGIFFAFSSEQFIEKREKDVTYVKGGYGMLIPKDNVQEFIERQEENIQKERAEFAKYIPMRDYVVYQLKNHECFYTGDYSEILEEIQVYYSTCTLEDIRAIYYEELNNENL